MAHKKELSHAEVWDDSSLINAWDTALQEYKVKQKQKKKKKKKDIPFKFPIIQESSNKHMGGYRVREGTCCPAV